MVEKKVFVGDLKTPYNDLSYQKLTELGVSVLLRLLLAIRNVDECWEWKGAQHGGYGVIYVKGGYKYMHRLSYETFQGKLISKLHIDHLCENKLCFNPFHLEQVTNLENTRRHFRNRKMCKNGLHELTADNLILFKEGTHARGQSLCKVCREAIIQKTDLKRRSTWMEFTSENEEDISFTTFLPIQMVSKYEDESGNYDIKTIRKVSGEISRKNTIIRACNMFKIPRPDNIDELVKDPAACAQFYKEAKEKFKLGNNV